MAAATDTDVATRWRVEQSVLARAWDGEVVAHNDVTGHTHHFMDLAAWIFEQLKAREMTEAELWTAAAAELELSAESDLAVSVANTLELFQRLSLLEAAPSG
jgi:hypothetical protein